MKLVSTSMVQLCTNDFTRVYNTVHTSSLLLLCILNEKNYKLMYLQ